MRTLSLLLVFAAVAFCVVSGDLSTHHKRSTGECENGVTYEIDESTMTFTASGTGRLQRCNPPNAQQIKTVIVKEGITQLGYGSLALGAFQNWYSLSSVTLPSTLTKMEANTFRSTSITSFHVPKRLETFDGNSFYNCTKLTKFTVDSGNTEYVVDNDILYTKNKVAVVRYPPGKTDRSYVMPDSVRKVGRCGFQNSTHLKSITLSKNLHLIEKFGFHSSGIKSIIIPASVEEIEESAFYFDDNLAYVKYLGDSDPWASTSAVFNYCPKLTSVCVESNYKDKTFCNFSITTGCPDPEPDSSSASTFLPSAFLAMVLFAFFMLF